MVYCVTPNYILFAVSFEYRLLPPNEGCCCTCQECLRVPPLLWEQATAAAFARSCHASEFHARQHPKTWLIAWPQFSSFKTEWRGVYAENVRKPKSREKSRVSDNWLPLIKGLTALQDLSPFFLPKCVMSHIGSYAVLPRTSPEQLHLFAKMNRSIAGMQTEIRTRWGDSKSAIGPHVSHLCGMSPSRVWKRDHQVWNVLKHWETRLKRDLQGWSERTLAVRTFTDE